MDDFAFVWTITLCRLSKIIVLDECVVALNSRLNPYCVDTKSRDHQKPKTFNC